MNKIFDLFHGYWQVLRVTRITSEYSSWDLSCRLSFLRAFGSISFCMLRNLEEWIASLCLSRKNIEAFSLYQIYHSLAPDEGSYMMKIDEDDESFHLSQVLVSLSWYFEILCFRSRSLFSHFGCLLCM